MQLGIDSFVAAVPDTLTRESLSPADRLSHLLDEIESADRVGLDVFGIGEHHRAEFLDSAPETILAAAAVRTERIRLTSAVTVLSANDPVRIFQQFATIDLLSRGRAEMIVGRSLGWSTPCASYGAGCVSTALSTNASDLVWGGRHAGFLCACRNPRPSADGGYYRR